MKRSQRKFYALILRFLQVDVNLCCRRIRKVSLDNCSYLGDFSQRDKDYKKEYKRSGEKDTSHVLKAYFVAGCGWCLRKTIRCLYEKCPK